jgi:RND family efflux transporter MFP subunit
MGIGPLSKPVNVMPNNYAKFSFAAALIMCLVGGRSLAAEPSATPDGFHCVITPSQTVELGTAVPGQLHEVLVDRSDTVTSGQIVASLDSRVEAANLEIARFRAATETQVRLREAAFAIDRRTERRLSSLAASKVASAQDKDRAARESRLSAWRVRQAKDDLELYALEMARAEARVDRRTIRSPIDGTVLARLHNPGEYIEDDPLLRIVKLDPLYVEAILPMRLFGRIEAGMQADVIPELEGSGTHVAKVDLVDAMGDAASGTFGVRLTLSNPDKQIPAGVKCRVQLNAATPLLSNKHEAENDAPRLAAAEKPRR